LELKKRVLETVEARSRDVVGFVQNLVRAPSVNRPPDGDEAKCQELVAEKFKELGLQIDRFRPDQVEGIRDHPAFLTGRNYANRENVVGVLRGEGGGRSLILTGHMDVVPLGPWAWTVPPWGGELRDGKIYGRGVLDMKAGVGAMIMALQSVLETGAKLKGDIILESVVDEEFGGVNGTLSCILRGYRADAVVSPEPTALSVSPGCLGGLLFRITTRGGSGIPVGRARAATQSNSVIAGMAVIEALFKYEDQRQARVPRHPLWRSFPCPIPSPLMISAVEAGVVGGIITTPEKCVIEAWFTSLPSQYKTRDEWENELKAFLAKASEKDVRMKGAQVEIESVGRWHPGYAGDRDHPIVKVVRRNLEEASEKPVKVLGFPAPGDLWAVALYGNMPALYAGPAGDGAHASDEYVTIESLMAVTKAYALTILDWCT